MFFIFLLLTSECWLLWNKLNKEFTGICVCVRLWCLFLQFWRGWEELQGSPTHEKQPLPFSLKFPVLTKKWMPARGRQLRQVSEGHLNQWQLIHKALYYCYAFQWKCIGKYVIKLYWRTHLRNVLWCKDIALTHQEDLGWLHIARALCVVVETEEEGLRGPAAHYPFPPGKLIHLLRFPGKGMLFISVSTLLSGPPEKLGSDQVQFR